ncbi:MAG: phosphodiester glycosidase family protein [Gloeomargaritaceae cyanobacterium C42_A2020_066]|nr:phosphodiester glycosidase family protein [Gloeomargaritaceae cyanobacterium C42_A2020_066]
MRFWACSSHDRKRKPDATGRPVAVHPVAGFLGALVLLLGGDGVWATPMPVVMTQASPEATLLKTGSQVRLNGQVLPIPWAQWQTGGDPTPKTGVADVAFSQAAGLELRDSAQFYQQPIAWFGQTLTLATWFYPTGSSRYLDLTTWLATQGWTVQPQDETLQITAPLAQIQAIRQGQTTEGARWVVELDRPAVWSLVRRAQGLGLRLGATGGARFQPQFPDLTFSSQATVVPLNGGEGTPRFSTLANPPRLVVDWGPPSSRTFPSRTIAWAPGITWRQAMLTAAGRPVAVTWLDLDVAQAALQVRPFWDGDKEQVGIVQLGEMARRNQAIAAINGGFFNRITQLPLGSLRSAGRWYSGPILGRGVLAWDDQGTVGIHRLALREVLVTAAGGRVDLTTLNSGYPRAGMARYTSAWGSRYVALTDSERVLTVEEDRVTRLSVLGPAGRDAVPIPDQGYLLVARSAASQAALAPPGTAVQIQIQWLPTNLEPLPHILGAGPVLLQAGRPVLDGASEGFQPSFLSQRAARSGVGLTAAGRMLWIATSPETPLTLTEFSQLLSQMGAQEALNLDGGSSTSLYLGGGLIQPGAGPLARVHNGLGLFAPARRLPVQGAP